MSRHAKHIGNGQASRFNRIVLAFQVEPDAIGAAVKARDGVALAAQPTRHYREWCRSMRYRTAAGRSGERR